MKCQYYRQKEDKTIIIYKESKKLCLICYYFCYSGSLTQKPPKVVQESDTQNCNCQVHNHADLIGNIIKYLKFLKNSAKAQEAIGIVNQILITKHEGKYLIEYDDQNQQFLKQYETNMKQMERKMFKWLKKSSDEIHVQINFFKNIRLYWTNFETEIQSESNNQEFIQSQYFPSCLSVNSFHKIIPLEYIQKICKFSIRESGANSFHLSQIFYSKLFTFYKEIYLMQTLKKLLSIDYECLQRTNPICRIQLRKNNKNHFRKHFPKLPGRFDPVAFSIECLNNFLLDFNFRWIGGDHQAHIQVIQIAQLFFRYGVLELDESVKIFEMLYQKIQSIKNLQNIVNNDYTNQLNNNFITISVGSFNQWACGFRKIRQLMAQIIFDLVFQKQDLFIEKVITGKKVLKLDGEIVQAFFEQVTSKKFIDLIFNYLLNEIQIDQINFVSDKVVKIVKDLLMSFGKVHDIYHTGLNLIKQSSIQKYLYALNHTQVNHQSSIISRSTNSILQNYFFNKITYLDHSKLNQDLYNLFNKIQQMIIANNERDHNWDSSQMKIGFSREQLLPQIDKAYLFQQSSPRLKKSNKFNTYKIQKYLYDQNVTTNLIVIYKEFYEIMEEKLIERFYEIFKYLFANNSSLIPLLLNQQILTLFFSHQSLKINKFQFLDFIIKCFDKQWICTVKTNLRDHIFHIFSILKASYLKDKNNGLLEAQLISIVNFLRNWQGNVEREKRFNKFMPNDNILILEKMYDFLKELVSNDQFLDTMKNKKVSSNLINTILERISSSIQGLFTDQILKNYRSYFDLHFFEHVLPNIVEIDTHRSLLIIFQNLYINFKENLITKRKLYGIQNNQYIEKPYIHEAYDRIINVIISMLLKANTAIQNNTITDKNQFEDYLINCLCASILRLSKYLLNLEQNQTDQFAKYMLMYRQLLNTCLITQKNFCQFLQIQNYGLKNQIITFKMKISKLDQITAENRECLMLSNILKKYTRYLVKKNENSENRIRYFLHPSEMSKFRLALTSNSRETRQDALKRIKQIIKQQQQKNQSGLLFKIQMYYLEAKLHKLTNQGKNPYLNSLIILNKDGSDQLDEGRIMINNFCNFIIRCIKFGDKQKRNQVMLFVEFLCNILFFVTKVIQDQLFLHFDRNPQLLKLIWQEIITSWNFITRKSVLDKYWKDETTKLIIILKFNQYLVEENNHVWKSYFGKYKIYNTNIVDLAYNLQNNMITSYSWNKIDQKNYLHNFNDRNRKYLFPVAFALREFINELVIGPHLDNIAILHSKHYTNFNQILGKYCKNLKNDPLSVYKNLILEYLLIILETNNRKLIEEIQNDLSLQFLKNVYCNSIRQLYCFFILSVQQYNKHNLITSFSLKVQDLKGLLLLFQQEPQFSSHDLIRMSCKIYNIIQIVAYYQAVGKILIKTYQQAIISYKNYYIIQINQTQLCCYWFLSQITIGIQIIRYYTKYQKKQRQLKTDNQVILYYFKKPGSTLYLSKQTKNDFQISVKRQSGESKLTSIMQMRISFELEIVHNKNNYSKMFRLFGFIENIHYFQRISYFIAILINSLYIADFTTSKKYQYQLINSTALALSIVQIIINAIFYVCYAVFRLPLDYEINKYAYKNQFKIKRLTFFQKFSVMVTTIFTSGSIALLLYLILTLLSIVWIKFFIAFSLILIININQTMGYVIKAITKYKYQLIFTYILGLIIVYILTFISYIKYSNIFIVSATDGTSQTPKSLNEIIAKSDPNQGFCNGLLSCYLNVINIGIRSGTGIQFLQAPRSYYNPDYIPYLVLSVVFFYLIDIIMMNMIFGIIISTFAVLRNQQRVFQDDKNNKCFMCHIDRNQFESQKLDFDQHQEIQHNLWNYVYFLYMIQKKTYKDCNAIENYLKRQVDNNSIRWMPLNVSKKLNLIRESKTKQINQEIEQIQMTEKQYLKKALEQIHKIVIKSAQKMNSHTKQSKLKKQNMKQPIKEKAQLSKKIKKG